MKTNDLKNLKNEAFENHLHVIGASINKIRKTGGGGGIKMRKMLLAAISIIISCSIIGSSVSAINVKPSQITKPEPVPTLSSISTETSDNVENSLDSRIAIVAEEECLECNQEPIIIENIETVEVNENECLECDSGALDIQESVEVVSIVTPVDPPCEDCVEIMNSIGQYSINYVQTQMSDWEGYWYPGLIAELIQYFIIGTLQGYDLFGPIFGFSATELIYHVAYYVIDFISHPDNLLGDAVAAIWGIGVGITSYLVSICDNLNSDPSEVPTYIPISEILETGTSSQTVVINTSEETQSGSMSL